MEYSNESTLLFMVGDQKLNMVLNAIDLRKKNPFLFMKILKFV